MDQSVVGVTIEFEVVDVGRPALGVVELVVGLARRRSGTTTRAATIAIDERDPLVAVGEANRASQVERLAVGAVHDAHHLRSGAQLEEE